MFSLFLFVLGVTLGFGAHNVLITLLDSSEAEASKLESEVKGLLGANTSSVQTTSTTTPSQPSTKV